MHLLCAGLLCLCGRALGYTGWVGGVQLCNSLCNLWLARGLAFCLFCVQVSFVCVTEPLVTPVGWVGCSSAIPSVILGWPGGLPFACFVAGLLCLDVRVFLTSGLATHRSPESALGRPGQKGTGITVPVKLTVSTQRFLSASNWGQARGVPDENGGNI